MYIYIYVYIYVYPYYTIWKDEISITTIRSEGQIFELKLLEDRLSEYSSKFHTRPEVNTRIKLFVNTPGITPKPFSICLCTIYT